MGSLKLLTFEFYLFLNCFMRFNDIAHNDNAILFSLCVLVLNIDQGIPYNHKQCDLLVEEILENLADFLLGEMAAGHTDIGGPVTTIHIDLKVQGQGSYK